MPMTGDDPAVANPTDREGERGIVLAIAAISMVMLLVFTAFAIDLGSVYIHRQEDQTAADIAVIAVGFDRYTTATATAAAVDALNKNLGTSFTAASMNTCGTVGMPTGWSSYAGANCLSHDTSWTRLMLHVPPQTYKTSFARLAGIESFDHTAFAVVSIEGPTGGGGVLPVIAQANAGSYQCLKVGASNVPDDQCNNSSSGNFGLANFSKWGNEAMGTTAECNGDGKDRMSEHLAMGIDHDISRLNFAPHNGTTVIDTSSCGAIPAPNAVTTITGNVPNWVGHGIIDGAMFSDGRPARLRRVEGVDWFTDTIIDGKTVDDTPLWEFINPSLGVGDNAPRSCRTDQFVGNAGGLNTDNDLDMTSLPLTVATHLISVPVKDRMIKLIERCFDHYRGVAWTDHGAFNPGDPSVGCTGTCNKALFTRDSKAEFPNFYDIQLSSRFAYVPVTNTPSIGWNGNSTLTVDSIAPVYLQRVYGGNCDPSGCGVTFDPGFGYTSSASSNTVSAFTAFLFPPGSLPGGLDLPGAPSELGQHRIPRLIR